MSLKSIDGGRPNDLHEEIALSTASAIEKFPDETVLVVGKNTTKDKYACTFNGPFLKKSTGLFEGSPNESFGVQGIFTPPIGQIARFYTEKYRNQDWSELSAGQLIEAVAHKVNGETEARLVENVSRKVLAALQTPPSAGGDDTPMSAAAVGRP